MSVSFLSRAVMGSLDKGVGLLGGVLEKHLRTGRMRADVWIN